MESHEVAGGFIQNHTLCSHIKITNDPRLKGIVLARFSISTFSDELKNYENNFAAAGCEFALFLTFKI